MTDLVAIPGTALLIAGGTLLVALVLAVIRLVRGPSLPDRVVAFELISMLSIGVIALAALHFGVEALLDAALILALISFVATIAFSRFILARRHEGGRP